MQYTLIINNDAGGTPAARALDFARAVVEAGHHLRQVFFYADGVRAVPETVDTKAWATIAEQQETELILCSASADRLGIQSPPARFEIAGLGALIEAGADSDRVISFG